MGVKFLLTIDSNLRARIKREARRHNISMNEYIAVVLEQFVNIKRERNGASKQEPRGSG